MFTIWIKFKGEFFGSKQENEENNEERKTLTNMCVPMFRGVQRE